MNTDQLDLRQLRCLVAVAEAGTFTDAASRLQISQPAVSRAVARLEEVLGVRLVERTTRTVALTEVGIAFVREVSAALRRIDDAVDALRGRTRPLRLGYAWAAFGKYTTAVLRTWRAEHPDVALEVHRIDDRSGGLASSRVDVAIIRGPFSRADLQAELLFTEGRLAALPVGHPLAERVAVTMGELAARDEPVALTPSVGTTTIELWPPHARPSGRLEVDNIDEWLTVIAAGDAFGLTPASTAFQHPNPGIVYRPVNDVSPVEVHLAWPVATPHPRVETFAELVHRCIWAAGD